MNGVSCGTSGRVICLIVPLDGGRGRHCKRFARVLNLRQLIANYPADPLLDPTTTRAHGVDEMRVVAPLFTLARVQGGGNIGSAAVRTRYPEGSTWWWVRTSECYPFRRRGNCNGKNYWH